MNIVVDPELKAYIDPLTPDEHAALESSLLSEGCRDALVLWGDVLVDGHNRYGICQQHGLPFQTMQHPGLRSMDDVHLWMIDQHLGRRSVSDFQRGLLALRKREIIAAQQARARDAEPAPAAGNDPADDAQPPAATAPVRLPDREALAKAARLSSSQVGMIEKIQKQAAPEVVAAVRAGQLSINAAATLATLPAADQAAAAAGGADAMKQAARQVREAKRKAPPAATAGDAVAEAPATDDGVADTLASLRLRVAELSAENADLRRQLQVLQSAATG